MSFAYGGQDEGDAIATLRRAVDIGVTFFDTAEIYGPFENEKLVGKFPKLCRHLFGGSPGRWMLTQELHPMADRANSALGGIPIFWNQKSMEAGDIFERCRRPYQPWHLGGCTSSPASSRANHVSASSAVTCKPVA